MSTVVGIQGSAGAFHEQAAHQMFGKNVRIRYLPTFDDMFNALNDGKIDIAVAAIANVNVGFIDAPHEELLINGDKYWINGETYVPVAHQLLGIPGAKLSDIKTVHSMAPALQQCVHNLRKLLPHAEIVEEDDTALSAELVKALNSKHHAAIASLRAGEINGLDVIHTNMQDNKKNITRFLALKPRQPGIEMANGMESKTSILLETPDKHGALFKALAPFWITKVNISTLHSSFVEDTDFSEKFFLEFDAGIKARKTRVILRLLGFFGCKVEVLGSYQKKAVSIVREEK